MRSVSSAFLVVVFLAACSESSTEPDPAADVIVFVDDPASSDGILAGYGHTTRIVVANTGSVAIEEPSVGLCFGGEGPVCVPETWTEVDALPADTTVHHLLSAEADPMLVGIESTELILVACIRDGAATVLGCGNVSVLVRPNHARVCGERGLLPIGVAVPLDDPAILCVVGSDTAYVAQVVLDYGVECGIHLVGGEDGPAFGDVVVYTTDGRPHMVADMPDGGTGIAPEYSGSYYLVVTALFDEANMLVVPL